MSPTYRSRVPKCQGPTGATVESMYRDSTLSGFVVATAVATKPRATAPRPTRRPHKTPAIGGEGGIRTPGTARAVQWFSRAYLVAACGNVGSCRYPACAGTSVWSVVSRFSRGYRMATPRALSVMRGSWVGRRRKCRVLPTGGCRQERALRVGAR